MNNKNEKKSSNVTQNQHVNKVERDNFMAAGDVNITNSEHTSRQAKVKPSNKPDLQSDKDGTKSYDVFISYWGEEEHIALLIKEWILDVFQERFDVFVSSDANTIGIGAKWLEEIENALHSAKIALILISEASSQRRWINFETGFVWGRGIPVVFLCHSGLTPSTLPHPYQTRQSLDMQESGFTKRFLEKMAERFHVKRLGSLDFEGMEKKLIETLNKNTL